MTECETTQTSPPSYACTFCGQPWDAVQRLLAGPNRVYICNECITLCYSIITAPPTEDAPCDLPPASPTGPTL